MIIWLYLCNIKIKRTLLLSDQPKRSKKLRKLVRVYNVKNIEK